MLREMQIVLGRKDKTKRREERSVPEDTMQSQIKVVAYESPRWTEWPIETACAVHVLAVLALLLLAHTVDIVPRNLGIFGGSESGKTHALSHHRFHLILVCVFLEVHFHFLRKATGNS